MLSRTLFRTSRQGGFTLIEVLVSMVVFAIGMLALAAMFVTQTRGNVFSGGMSVANALGIQQIEQIMNQSTPMAGLAGAFPAGTTYLTVGGLSCAAGTSPPCYARTIAYPSGVGGGPGGTTTVQVTVGWTDQGGGSHSIALSTLRGPP